MTIELGRRRVTSMGHTIDRIDRELHLHNDTRVTLISADFLIDDVLLFIMQRMSRRVEEATEPRW